MIYMKNIKKQKILTYDELLIIESGENNEKLVNTKEICDDVICFCDKNDMHKFVGDNIYVRNSVIKKLCLANKELKKINNNYNLKIFCGYRHPEIQKKHFEEQKSILAKKNPELTDEKLNKLTHDFVAVPDVAGHVTGGAVDITITTPDGDLDMGGEISDFLDPDIIKTYSNKISKDQFENRKILHDLLVDQNFAPFYGEWWHFSYGDKEWAAFYDHNKSLYSLIYFKI
jgi:zinc D-Ala-D-Ala dipeptidase